MPMRPVAVGTTVTQLAAYSPQRTALTLVNQGTARVYISNDQLDVATRGFPVDPGVVVGMTRQEGDEPELAMFAVASSGTQDVRVTEGFAGREKAG